MDQAPEPDDPLIGQTIGNYRIASRIGAGGMGAVYLGVHPNIDRKVAVKVLLPEHSTRQDLVQRFFNEAKTAATLRHPALVDVFDFGILPSGAGYLVMDFLEGESLAARLGRVAPLAPEGAAEIARQLAAGVAAAHGKGIVHRDLKPDNIFLVPDPELPEGERVKILDFGIAKLLQPGVGKSATSTGMLMGTPLYMAPEQCRGAGQVDHRADIYAAGCILYEMLAGHPPFNYEGAGEILVAHLTQEPRPLVELDATIPAALAATTMRALSKDPERRQQSMVELGSELQMFLRGLGLARGTTLFGPRPDGPARATGGAPAVGSVPPAPAASAASPAAVAGVPTTARPPSVAAAPVNQPADPAAASVPGAQRSGARSASALALAPTTFSEAAVHAAPTGPASLPPPRPSGATPPGRSRAVVATLAMVAAVTAGGFFVLRARGQLPGWLGGASGSPAGARSARAPAKPPPGAAANPGAAFPGEGTPSAGGPPTPAGPVPHPGDEGAGADTPTVGSAPAETPKVELPPAPADTAAGPAVAGGLDPAEAVLPSGRGTSAEMVQRPGGEAPDLAAPTTKPASTEGSSRSGAAPAPRAGMRAKQLFHEGLRLRNAGRDDRALLSFRNALRTGALTASERAEAEANLLELRKIYGELDILTQVPGVTVTIGNRVRGTTPLPEPIILLARKYVVTLTAPGRAPENYPADVQAGQKAYISFKPAR